MEKIAVIGMGPVGLATALGFAHYGYAVTGADVDEEKIRLLQEGRLPFYEKGLKRTFAKLRSALSFTARLEAALMGADVVFLTVGTPSAPDGDVDMAQVRSAVGSAAKYAERGSLLVLKSTVPVGTNAAVAEELRALGRDDMGVASNPEFLAQGSSFRDTVRPSRIVIGTNDGASRKRLEALYRPFPGKKLFMSPSSAEAVKYASNCYLAMRVSYFNELANICALTGADVGDVIRGVTSDKRIGEGYCSPGLGYGGSCFPKDTRALETRLLRDYGYEAKLVRATREVNERQAEAFCERIDRDGGKRTIAVLGIAFKAGTDDLRDSPALAAAESLMRRGHRVIVWDPAALGRAKTYFGGRAEYAETPEDAVRAADTVLIATDWKQIADIDLGEFCGKRVFDGKNLLLPRRAEIGFEYHYVGGSLNEGGPQARDN